MIEEQMEQKFTLSFDHTLKPTIGNNLKKLSLRMSMIEHQQAWKQTSCTKVRVQLIQVAYYGISPL